MAREITLNEGLFVDISGAAFQATKILNDENNLIIQVVL